MATVFFSYSHADEALRNQLEIQLSMLKHQGVIETWHDRRIPAGADLDTAIGARINADDIILLLVSPEFIGSEYCYNKEMARAMERHNAGDAVVIPVILRPCEWLHAPFGKLRGVPRDGKPVTLWPDRDQAFLEVTQEIRKVAETINAKASKPALRKASPIEAQRPKLTETGAASVRSSNLRLSQSFTEREKDQFRVDTFAYMARFFENSLFELTARNRNVDGTFRQIDANRFTATIYTDGKAAARCTVFMGGGLVGNGINYVSQETLESSTYNETLSVEADDQSLYLRSLGMSHYYAAQGEKSKLSQEGASELYWGILIAPLQQRR